MRKTFDAIVSNPPYSIKWVGDADPTLINDERFAPAGKLAPKSYADFAFIMHALSYLSSVKVEQQSYVSQGFFTEKVQKEQSVNI